MQFLYILYNIPTSYVEMCVCVYTCSMYKYVYRHMYIYLSTYFYFHKKNLVWGSQREKKYLEIKPSLKATDIIAQFPNQMSNQGVETLKEEYPERGGLTESEAFWEVKTMFVKRFLDINIAQTRTAFLCTAGLLPQEHL